MDLDKALVSAILREGRPALERASQMGVTSARLNGEGRQVFDFVQEYLRKNGAMPVVDQIMGKLGVVIDEDQIFGLESVPDKSANFFIEEVNNRHLHGKIQEGLDKVIQMQTARKPLEAYQELERLSLALRSEQVGMSNVEPLWKLGPDIWKYYERIKSGERGVLTPWPSINDITMGFWPEDLILFAARQGVGKSWTAVQLASYAWNNPKPQTGERQKVLFITTELSRMRIGMRFLAAHEKLPYGEFTHGRMSIFQEDKAKKAIERYFNDDYLYIVGGDFDFQIESLVAAIDTVKPDLVILDGVYLLRVPGANRTERMANAFDECKRIAKRKRVPLAIFTQFNREVKKDIAKTVQIESIAMSDVGGWNADLCFGLLQTEDMRALKQMAFHTLKAREGQGKEVLVNWDFERMDFSELNSNGGGGGDADEKGTSLDMTDPAEDDDLPF